MSIQHLTPEQVQEWTPEQKDRWWLENVYRGDMPQLTLRSGITGFVLGLLLSLTNLYVGAKTGWTLGVGITSVILAFGTFRLISKLKLGSDISILENNCSQSISTAAGYMTAPLISSLAAYMMVTGTVIPMWQTYIWMVALAILGVLFAFPMKRRFINYEQMPFPEGRAAGVVMDTLHHGSGKEGVFQAKLLAFCGLGAAALEMAKSGAIMEKLHLKFLTLPGYLDGWIYKIGKPSLWGTSLKELSIRPDTDFVMMAAGGLMGIRTAFSLIVGALINYAILAPIMISKGDIEPVIKDGAVLMNSLGDPTYGFKQITFWALWCGVAMMTTASLYGFFSKPKMIVSAFAGVFSKKEDGAKEDCVAHIELPMKVFVIGIPIFGLITVLLAKAFFGVDYWMGAIAVPLVFVFSLIGANSTGLTSITPTGALGKLTQLTYGVLAPGNIKTNLMTAGITGEVSSNVSNLLMDIKPGYMLGAKPRQQAIGHVIGVFAGAMAAIPVFYAVFLQGDPANLQSEKFAMPAATIWKAVAEALTQGLSTLPVSAQWAALCGGVAGIVLELVRSTTKNRFPLSPVGIGLAFVISFNTCMAMAMGAFLFALAARLKSSWASPDDPTTVKNQEPICAGVIAGGALMGIAVILVENFYLSA
ncbi:MAG: OPT family oligopeptide transporter [Planctomycetota bacterium]|nr:MAG: OPT family oligopeptide transporter [Planctomycetota bacterium]